MDYLTTARQLGMKVGIASNSSRDWVEGHVAHRELGGYFDAIRTRDDVKPAPDVPGGAGRQARPGRAAELFLAALDAIGVPPDRAVAVEDSPTGSINSNLAGGSA